MSPRRSAAESKETRAQIIDRARVIASVAGLDGVTIGRLAADLGMSKAGVLGHFGSKEALQLAAFAAAVDNFVRQVPATVPAAPPGLDRLRRLCGAWIHYLESDGTTPGGCLLASAATEFDGRPGPVRDAVAEATRRWLDVLAAEVHHAVDAGELARDTDAEQIAFELNGVALGTNQAVQLQRDPAAGTRARRAVDRILAAASA